MGYLIGDALGNMWNGEREFLYNKGIIFHADVKFSKETIKFLEEKNPDLKGALKVYKFELIEILEV